MDYQDINAQTIDGWVRDGWEWGKLLDENEEPYDPCNIDEIAGVVRIVEVREVSKHYE